MKRIYSILFLLTACFLVAKAQTSLIATLSHNGEISIFSGSKALIEACKVAADGDVITLSSGQFDTATPIEKALTIRGAGMYGENATIISGSTTLKTGDVMFEGLAFNAYITLSAATFLKCRVPSISTSSTSSDITAIHCDLAKISNSIHGTYSGCVLTNISALNNSILDNCLIYLVSSSVYNWGSETYYKNSIIVKEDTKASSASNKNTFLNCVYIGDAKNPMKSNIPNETNRIYPSGTQFLKDGTTTYELLDELQTTWLGSDGTQVGIHGGSLPFDPTTTNPQIKKFDVSAKTSADGKLSVDIIVDSE